MYIHHYTCISPQQTFGHIDLTPVNASAEGKMYALEPALEGVPPGMLRRMSKAVRMGMGAALGLIKNTTTDGIIIGTANGGMEDCIKFLNQIVDYNEGKLTPGNFVQSTPNALGGQLSLVSKNYGYNATHVHLGLAFENALQDAQLLLAENRQAQYLVGGVDEISTYNYHIDYLAGWYDNTISNHNLYNSQKPATIAGEGAAMFTVNNSPGGAAGQLQAMDFFHQKDADAVAARFTAFLSANNITVADTIFISGENGDTRLQPFYTACETKLPATIIRYKHFTGEYPTAASFALWLACYALQHQPLPAHFYKQKNNMPAIKNIVLYNQYHGMQHSFMFIKKP